VTHDPDLARDEHDRTSPAVHHPARGFPGDLECGIQIHVENCAPLLEAGFKHPPVIEHAGAVNQPVDRAFQPADRIGDHNRSARDIGKIGLKHPGPGHQLLDDRRLLAVPDRRDTVGAFG